MRKKSSKALALAAIIAIGAGVATGFGTYKLAARTGVAPGAQPIQKVAGDNVQNGQVFGSADVSTFKDSAQGYLEQGGLEGEGSHRILRPGGETQTVYITSSVTDLDKLVGMEVKVWGETFKGQKAGWLMDVGRIEVLNTEAQPPTED